MTQWTSRIDSPLGTQRELGIRGAMSGPLSGNAALGLAFGTRVRDGFTVNDVTGNTLDDRSATFGRAQFVYMPTPRWETRFIFGGERDRDGDYALNDLEETRRNPYHAQRNVEGYTDRDIWSSTILVRHEGPRYAFSSTTGGVWWKTHDFTDLDYSAMPLMTRDNAEKDTQFTQEFRVASAARAPRAPVAQLRRGVAGRRSCSSRSTTRRTPSPRSRPTCCRRRSRSPSPSTRRLRSSTTWDSASTRWAR